MRRLPPGPAPRRRAQEHRAPLPPRHPARRSLDVKDPEQALQQFVNQSPWDEQQVLPGAIARHLAETFASPEGIFVIDDTTFPKQGKHSVGVQRQYCGALGKKANCQVALSVHYVSPEGHYPLAMRLYLPESWLGDKERLDKAGVPRGASAGPRPRAQIALELLDRVRGEGLPGWLVVADAGYGVSEDVPRRPGRSAGLHYIVGVTDEMVVFTEEPRWDAPAAGRDRRPAADAATGWPRARPGR